MMKRRMKIDANEADGIVVRDENRTAVDNLHPIYVPLPFPAIHYHDPFLKSPIEDVMDQNPSDHWGQNRLKGRG